MVNGVSFHFFLKWTKNFLMEFFQVNCIVNGKVSSARYLIGNVLKPFKANRYHRFSIIKFAQQSGMKKNQFSPISTKILLSHFTDIECRKGLVALVCLASKLIKPFDWVFDFMVFRTRDVGDFEFSVLR